MLVFFSQSAPLPLVYRSPFSHAGRIGLVVAHLLAAREVPGSNRVADKRVSVFSPKVPAIRTLAAVPRSTQPSAI